MEETQQAITSPEAKETVVTVDDEGQMHIPKEFMKKHGWKNGDRFDIIEKQRELTVTMKRTDDPVIDLNGHITHGEVVGIYWWDDLTSIIRDTWMQFIPGADWFLLQSDGKKLEIWPVEVTGLPEG
jgi:AbrB family looped-hinge helix DNA binding protein